MVAQGDSYGVAKPAGDRPRNVHVCFPAGTATHSRRILHKPKQWVGVGHECGPKRRLRRNKITALARRASVGAREVGRDSDAKPTVGSSPPCNQARGKKPCPLTQTLYFPVRMSEASASRQTTDAVLPKTNVDIKGT